MVFCEGGRLLGEGHCSEKNLFTGEDAIYSPGLLLQMKYDDRFTDKLLQNNIASVGVPLIFAKIATGAISLTGKTTAQLIDMIKTKFKL